MNTILNTYKSRGGNFTFVNRTDRGIGVLEAEIAKVNPKELYIANISVDERFRRQGIATHLAKTTIRGVLETGHGIESCYLAVANPHVIPLIQNLLPLDRLSLYEEGAPGEIRHGLSEKEAVERVLVHQELERRYYGMNEEIPMAQDFSVIARFAINWDIASNFPLPTVIR